MSEDKGKKRKIAVFEDDPTFRSSYVSNLETRGFEVMVISNPGDVDMKQVEDFAPALISLDVNMPNKGGFEVFEEIKGNATLKDVPCVFVTSQGESAKERAIQLGAKKFFAKFETPITEIVQQIDNLI